MTICSLFKLYDLITAHKIIWEVMECSELRSLFLLREISYKIRNPGSIRKDLHTQNYSFNSPIARLQCTWNQLLNSICSMTSVGTFKRVIRRVA